MAPLPIVLLPGLDGTGDLFHPLVASSPRELRPLVVKLPPRGSYAELLHHVRSQLPPYERFVVLGESFSGPLALAVAREERSRVAAVILCNSFVVAPVTPMLRFLPWWILFSVRPPRWAVRHFLVGASASPELVSAVRAAVARTPRAVLVERMRSIFRLTATKSSPLNVPLLILSSRQDALVSPNLRALRNVAAAVVVKKLDGPHLLLQATPHQAWAEISAFLAQAG